MLKEIQIMGTLVQNDEQLTQFCAMDPPLDPATVRRQDPNEMWVLRDDSQQVIARCSIWWEKRPMLDGKKVGMIGHFGAESATSAEELLGIATARLADMGCQVAVGPMDGSTWQSYRAVTDDGTEPAFFLEPNTPSQWPRYFEASNFSPLAEYYSAIVTAPKTVDPRLAALTAQLAESDIHIRSIEPQNFEAELENLYPLVMASFEQNLLYTPIGKDEFMAQYQPLQPLLDPQLVLIAAHAGTPVGFVLCLPDLCQQQRGVAVDTVIIKTLAVHPDYQQLGVGGLLAAEVQSNIAQLGYGRIIHALMHETNHSRTISKRYGQTMRRYALYSKEI